MRCACGTTPHFVDQLGRPSGEAIGRLIPIEDIQPNPEQPRQALGDLTELPRRFARRESSSRSSCGRSAGRYQIIAGERRFRAAGKAGLAELPCVVRETTDAEMMELALVENLQRKDLTPFEEADGLKRAVETYGYTHERWPRSSARAAARSRRRYRSPPCRRTSASNVGWPTFSLSLRFFR